MVLLVLKYPLFLGEAYSNTFLRWSGNSNTGSIRNHHLWRCKRPHYLHGSVPYLCGFFHRFHSIRSTPEVDLFLTLIYLDKHCVVGVEKNYSFGRHQIWFIFWRDRPVVNWGIVLPLFCAIHFCCSTGLTWEGVFNFHVEDISFPYLLWLCLVRHTRGCGDISCVGIKSAIW